MALHWTARRMVLLNLCAMAKVKPPPANLGLPSYAGPTRIKNLVDTIGARKEAELAAMERAADVAHDRREQQVGTRLG